MDINRFAEIMSATRQNRKMTQEEFASRLGVTPQAVSKWERALGMPDVSLLEGICSVLQINANDLLGIAQEQIVENNDREEQKEIINNLFTEPIHITFGEELIPVFVDGLKTDILNKERKKLATKNGFLIPVIRVRDDTNLKPKEYCIKLYDKIVMQEELEKLNDESYRNIIRCLFQICNDHYADILNKQIVKQMVTYLKQQYPGVVDDIIPDKVSYLMYLKILTRFIEKGGKIRNQIRIIECVEEEILVNQNCNADSIADRLIRELK